MHRHAQYLSYVWSENEETVDRMPTKGTQNGHKMVSEWPLKKISSFDRKQKGKRKVMDLLCPIWSTLMVTKLQVVGNCVYKQSDNKKERNFFSRDGKSNRQASMYADQGNLSKDIDNKIVRIYVHTCSFIIATSLFYEVNDPLLQACYKP